MTILEWIFIGGIATTILLIIFAIYSLLRMIAYSQNLKKLPSKRIKNPKKRKKFAIRRRRLQKARKDALIRFITLVIMSGIMAGGSFYVKYYQSMNLTGTDSDSIVKAYYLLRDFNDQVELAKTQGDDQDKINQNIQYLSRSMASYGTKKASEVNTKEGQLALNRYYKAIMELGQNANMKYKNFFEDPALSEEYIASIKKIEQNYEQPVFKYYKVDEATLKEEK